MLAMEAAMQAMVRFLLVPWNELLAGGAVQLALALVAV